jgi:hypothetical protein
MCGSICGSSRATLLRRKLTYFDPTAPIVEDDGELCVVELFDEPFASFTRGALWGGLVDLYLEMDGNSV